MPSVHIDKADLFERLGRQYTTEEFDELCFEFGIELDEDTTADVEEAIKKGLPAERPQLKIDIPANRYDLLCIEGISRALRIFLEQRQPPVYKPLPPKEEGRRVLRILPETAQIRPYAAAAILRNVHFTPRSYASFIDLQDKLHANLCRRREFVAIGTHDYDTLARSGDFTYEARKPEDINFVPLNQTKKMNGRELMEFYENDKHLGRYLHIVCDSPVYPVIYDSNGIVASLPPIINGDHSKIRLETTNVFIECTATDETKLAIVLDIISSMFSEYASDEFSIEQVEVIYPNGEKRLTPSLEPRLTTARVSYINACTGLSLSPAEISKLLTRMGLSTTPSPTAPDELLVQVPVTRPDILHECDIMEDAAIGYGFNKLPRTFPSSNTVAQPFPINKLSDIVRREIAMAGWVEVLPLILCSRDENSTFLNQPGALEEAVHLANPKTLEYQVVRTSLLPGILKTVRENRAHSLPLKVFESSDVARRAPDLERRARNERRVAAVYSDKRGAFEVVHGLLDRVMVALGIPLIDKDSKTPYGYWIAESNNPTYFPGRAADIFYRPPPKSTTSGESDVAPSAATSKTTTDSASLPPPPSSTPAPASKPSALDTVKDALASALPTLASGTSRDLKIGHLGILHPSVLEAFEIKTPCSALEFNLEPFLEIAPDHGRRA